MLHGSIAPLALAASGRGAYVDRKGAGYEHKESLDMTKQNITAQDLVAIERRAHELRAEALSNGVKALVAWMRGRKPAVPGATRAA